MTQVQRLCAFGVAAMAALFTLGMEAQAGDPAALIQQKLLSQIKLTKTTADRSDIVTAGDVVVLQKDGLMMCSSTSSYAFSNTYSNGVLAANQKNRAKDAVKSFGFGHIPVFGSGTSATDAANNGCPSRKFVAGEKFWITGIAAQKDGILVSTFSDPYPGPFGRSGPLLRGDQVSVREGLCAAAGRFCEDSFRGSSRFSPRMTAVARVAKAIRAIRAIRAIKAIRALSPLSPLPRLRLRLPCRPSRLRPLRPIPHRPLSPSARPRIR